MRCALPLVLLVCLCPAVVLCSRTGTLTLPAGRCLGFTTYEGAGRVTISYRIQVVGGASVGMVDVLWLGDADYKKYVNDEGDWRYYEAISQFNTAYASLSATAFDCTGDSVGFLAVLGAVIRCLRRRRGQVVMVQGNVQFAQVPQKGEELEMSVIRVVS